MKKTYLSPKANIEVLELSNQILSGSQYIPISKKPVDHFDSQKMDKDRTIWE